MEEEMGDHIAQLKINSIKSLFLNGPGNLKDLLIYVINFSYKKISKSFLMSRLFLS